MSPQRPPDSQEVAERSPAPTGPTGRAPPEGAITRGRAARAIEGADPEDIGVTESGDPYITEQGREEIAREQAARDLGVSESDVSVTVPEQPESAPARGESPPDRATIEGTTDRGKVAVTSEQTGVPREFLEVGEEGQVQRAGIEADVSDVPREPAYGERGRTTTLSAREKPDDFRLINREPLEAASGVYEDTFVRSVEAGAGYVTREGSPAEDITVGAARGADPFAAASGAAGITEGVVDIGFGVTEGPEGASIAASQEQTEASQAINEMVSYGEREPYEFTGTLLGGAALGSGAARATRYSGAATRSVGSGARRAGSRARRAERDFRTREFAREEPDFDSPRVSYEDIEGYIPSDERGSATLIPDGRSRQRGRTESRERARDPQDLLEEQRKRQREATKPRVETDTRRAGLDGAETGAALAALENPLEGATERDIAMADQLQQVTEGVARRDRPSELAMREDRILNESPGERDRERVARREEQKRITMTRGREDLFRGQQTRERATVDSILRQDLESRQRESDEPRRPPDLDFDFDDESPRENRNDPLSGWTNLFEGDFASWL